MLKILAIIFVVIVFFVLGTGLYVGCIARRDNDKILEDEQAKRQNRDGGKK